MACINPDGTLHPVARKVLAALSTGATLAQLGETSSLPLYRIRSSLRELVEVGFIGQEEGVYKLTQQGISRLEQS